MNETLFHFYYNLSIESSNWNNSKNCEELKTSHSTQTDHGDSTLWTWTQIKNTPLYRRRLLINHKWVINIQSTDWSVLELLRKFETHLLIVGRFRIHFFCILTNSYNERWWLKYTSTAFIYLFPYKLWGYWIMRVTGRPYRFIKSGVWNARWIYWMLIVLFWQCLVNNRMFSFSQTT